MARLKKQLHEYGRNVTEISEAKFNDAEREDILTLKCKCGTKYQSTKMQVARRLNKGVPLSCRSCVNKKNRGSNG